jgi:hypothetical protein
MTDGTVTTLSTTFLIKAISSGGAFVWKTVEAVIVVCKWESLSLSDSTDFYFERHNEDPPHFLWPAADFFESNDTYCPANTFSITLNADYEPSNATMPDPSNTQMTISLQGTEFNDTGVLNDTSLVLVPETVGEYPFFILGESAGSKYLYKPAIFNVTGGCPYKDILYTTSGILQKTVGRNQGLIDLLSVEDVHNLFLTPDLCPPIAYGLTTRSG